MPTFKLTLAYDGTTFVGWQRQASGESIQGWLEDVLQKLEKQPVPVAGAGRTDAGVHAHGQVASVALTRDIDAATLRRALNANLPDAIRVVDATLAPAGFHARFASSSKVYQYRIWNSEVLDPFERRFVWHFPGAPLDAEAMDAAAGLLEGTHDFSSFQSAGATTATAVRTVFSSRVTRQAAASGAGSGDPAAAMPLLVYEVHGTGFLKHMVRSIAGTLVDVGRGRRTPASIVALLEQQSRGCAGETAPPSGLFLVRVAYQSPDL
jgi:tRNA pseudouridine38-40 synthase